VPANAEFADVAVDAVIGSLEDARAVARLVRGADAIVHAAGRIKALPCEFFAATRRARGCCGSSDRKPQPAALRPAVTSPRASRRISDYAASKLAAKPNSPARRRTAMVDPATPAVYGPGDRDDL